MGLLLDDLKRNARVAAGRPVAVATHVAENLVRFGIGYLGARSLPELSATEVMALAVVAGVEPTSDHAKGSLDRWRKLCRQHRPSDCQALVDSYRRGLERGPTSAEVKSSQPDNS